MFQFCLPVMNNLYVASLRWHFTMSTGRSQATPSIPGSGVQLHHLQAPPATRPRIANTVRARSLKDGLSSFQAGPHIRGPPHPAPDHQGVL